jgi:hypothetical protein
LITIAWNSSLDNLQYIEIYKYIFRYS